MTALYAPFARPLYVMLKPAGARCNLACRYCYYTEKEKLNSSQLLTDELLERFTREYLGAQTMPQVLFTWHGGEPLLRPLAFYRRAMELQQKYAGGRHIDNCIQTNGTLLTDEWCRFFRDNGWLVGISIDGTEEMHNAFRRNRSERGAGSDSGGSFAQVMRGIDLLNRHGVEWNAMAVVHRLNVERPVEFYHFFKEIGCRFLQFTPVVERTLPHPDGRTLAHVGDGDHLPLTAHSVRPDQWGRFLCTLFDEWVRHDVGQVFVQIFDATLANLVGVPPGICSLSPTCGHAAVMEADGEVYSCDHFVFPEYRLGNLRTHSLVEMLYGERQTDFGHRKQTTLPSQCRRCRFLYACHGECPKNRFARTADGEPGLNYLCEGYRRFFAHSAPYMAEMKRLLEAGLPPSQIMSKKVARLPVP